MSRTLPGTTDADLIALSPEEAIMAIGLITIFADDSAEEAESIDLTFFREEFEVFAKYSDDQLVEMNEKLCEFEGEVLYNSALATLNQNTEMAEIAFIVANLVAAVDDKIPESEEDYLHSLQAALNISDDRACQIIDDFFHQ